MLQALFVFGSLLPTMAFPSKMFEGEQFTLGAVIFTILGSAALLVFAGFVAVLRYGLREYQSWRSIGLVLRIMGWSVPFLQTLFLWNGYLYPGDRPRPDIATALIFWGVGTGVLAALSLLVHYLGRPNQGRDEQSGLAG